MLTPWGFANDKQEIVSGWTLGEQLNYLGYIYDVAYGGTSYKLIQTSSLYKTNDNGDRVMYSQVNESKYGRNYKFADTSNHWNIYNILCKLYSTEQERRNMENNIKTVSEANVKRLTGVSSSYLSAHYKGNLMPSQYREYKFPIRWHVYDNSVNVMVGKFYFEDQVVMSERRPNEISYIYRDKPLKLEKDTLYFRPRNSSGFRLIVNKDISPKIATTYYKIIKKTDIFYPDVLNNASQIDEYYNKEMTTNGGTVYPYAPHVNLNDIKEIENPTQNSIKNSYILKECGTAGYRKIGGSAIPMESYDIGTHDNEPIAFVRPGLPLYYDVICSNNTEDISQTRYNNKNNTKLYPLVSVYVAGMDYTDIAITRGTDETANNVQIDIPAVWGPVDIYIAPFSYIRGQQPVNETYTIDNLERQMENGMSIEELSKLHRIDIRSMTSMIASLENT